MDFSQFGLWQWIVIGLVALGCILLRLWIRTKKKAHQIKSKLKIYESEYDKMLAASQEKFAQEQEAFINKKMKELNEQERELEEKKGKFEEDLRQVEIENERRLISLQERYESESEKRLKALQENYEKKIDTLESINKREIDELKKERKKILVELEEYQRNLEEKAKNELEKIQKKYRDQMQLLQEENTKIMDEMQRLIKERRQTTTPPQDLRITKAAQDQQALLAKQEQPFTDRLPILEKQVETTQQVIEHLKEQLSLLEEMSKKDLAIAQSEIEELKLKIKMADLKV